MVVTIPERMGTILNSIVTAKQLHLIIISSYVHNTIITIDYLQNIVLHDLRDEYKLTIYAILSLYLCPGRDVHGTSTSLEVGTYFLPITYLRYEQELTTYWVSIIWTQLHR